MPRVNFLGIDLTSFPHKPSACIGLDEDLYPALPCLIYSDPEIINAIVDSHPDVVGIDAPLTLPRGLCCLEGDCSCRPEDSKKGRSCERELAKLGISCYFTTKKSIIKPMVYRGIYLRAELEKRGFKVIEVYPYATKVRLWDRPIPPKSTSAGLSFLRNHIVDLMPGFASQALKFNHDLCDAALAAYTARLHYLGETDLLGDPEEGLICVPKVQPGFSRQ